MKPREAAVAARDGIRAYPRATIARVCLLRALGALEEPADTVLAVAQAMLAVDSTSVLAWEWAAESWDVLGRRAEAGRAWNNVAALQEHDSRVVIRVVTALMRDHNAPTARPLIDRAVKRSPTIPVSSPCSGACC